MCPPHDWRGEGEEGSGRGGKEEEGGRRREGGEGREGTESRGGGGREEEGEVMIFQSLHVTHRKLVRVDISPILSRVCLWPWKVGEASLATWRNCPSVSTILNVVAALHCRGEWEGHECMSAGLYRYIHTSDTVGGVNHTAGGNSTSAASAQDDRIGSCCGRSQCAGVRW